MTIAFDWEEKQQNKLTKKKVNIMVNFLDKYLTKTINNFCFISIIYSFLLGLNPEGLESWLSSLLGQKRDGLNLGGLVTLDDQDALCVSFTNNRPSDKSV